MSARDSTQGSVCRDYPSKSAATIILRPSVTRTCHRPWALSPISPAPWMIRGWPVPAGSSMTQATSWEPPLAWKSLPPFPAGLNISFGAGNDTHTTLGAGSGLITTSANPGSRLLLPADKQAGSIQEPTQAWQKLLVHRLSHSGNISQQVVAPYQASCPNTGGSIGHPQRLCLLEPRS